MNKYPKGKIVQFYVNGKLTTGIVRSDNRFLDYILVTVLETSITGERKQKRYLLTEAEILKEEKNEPYIRSSRKDVKERKKRGRPRKTRKLG